MEGLDNRNGRASLRQSISKSAPKLWSGFGRWIALWAIILAIFGCSGGSGCSSCGGTSEDGSTSSGLGCSSAADPTAPPGLSILPPPFNPNTVNDSQGITCDLCDSFDIRLNKTFMDYINKTIADLVASPTTEKVIVSFINDLAGDGEALFEFLFGLDPFLSDMCLALFIEDNDGDPDRSPISFDPIDPNAVGLLPDIANQALKINFSLTNMALDFAFRVPDATGEEDCALLDLDDEDGDGDTTETLASAIDPTKFVPDPDLFVTLPTDAVIPNVDFTLILRPLAGDPAEFVRHGVVMNPDADPSVSKIIGDCANNSPGRLCPAKGKAGTWLALELPSLEIKAGLSIQLVAPAGANEPTENFARLLPFLSVNLGAKLTNAFNDRVAPYLGPTPLINIGDMLGGLAGSLGGSSGGSEESSSSCGCSFIGRSTTGNDLTGLLPILLMAGWLAWRRRSKT